ncbi:hypothetical protein GUJ93_ZPchr0006g46382 [Zizania palustris]|uniref:Uncharacterized protein n=1 Tax=Zizania palustris TaxID=103762 RepID=A0A8J5W4F7_ZIZPA|nr:hypothetical protein GUJ93_ZPchr0006g46382 [Zizania palustris]
MASATVVWRRYGAVWRLPRPWRPPYTAAAATTVWGSGRDATRVRRGEGAAWALRGEGATRGLHSEGAARGEGIVWRWLEGMGGGWREWEVRERKGGLRKLGLGNGL